MVFKNKTKSFGEGKWIGPAVGRLYVLVVCVVLKDLVLLNYSFWTSKSISLSFFLFQFFFVPLEFVWILPFFFSRIQVRSDGKLEKV